MAPIPGTRGPEESRSRGSPCARPRPRRRSAPPPRSGFRPTEANSDFRGGLRSFPVFWEEDVRDVLRAVPAGLFRSGGRPRSGAARPASGTVPFGASSRAGPRGPGEPRRAEAPRRRVSEVAKRPTVLEVPFFDRRFRKPRVFGGVLDFEGARPFLRRDPSGMPTARGRGSSVSECREAGAPERMKA